MAFVIAVHRVTGEIAILQSVHAADAGVGHQSSPAFEPDRRGYRSGAGWALYEKMVFDSKGKVVNPSFRNYRIPAFADIPRSEDLLREDGGHAGPARRKSMSEAPINPMRLRLSAHIAPTTGIRFP
jgi:CO/xanthine dehydrogenase Mo-binding subunit